MDLRTMSIEQLKALAFDIISQNALNQQNLQIIQTELQLRADLPKEEN